MSWRDVVFVCRRRLFTIAFKPKFFEDLSYSFFLWRRGAISCDGSPVSNIGRCVGFVLSDVGAAEVEKVVGSTEKRRRTMASTLGRLRNRLCRRRRNSERQLSLKNWSIFSVDLLSTFWRVFRVNDPRSPVEKEERTWWGNLGYFAVWSRFFGRKSKLERKEN
jgi:hypothetical protein